MNREDRYKMQVSTLAKLLFLPGNADIMRSALRDANARRMQAAQAKAAQEKAASTSEWNTSKATNKQPVVDAIEIDDDKPVVQGKGRTGSCDVWYKLSRVMRRGKKQRLERIAKTNEMWDALKIKEKVEEERRKKER